MIRFTGVNKWFGKLHVLKNIDLHIDAGEVVVVCGPSGSGKSTLIRCINRLEGIEEGELVVDGMRVHEKKTDMTRLRAEIGFVFQQFNLYPHMTALANITIAPIKVRKLKKQEAERLGREILRRVGLADKADAYPNQLSGGQQQRVAIARGLCMRPKIMLFITSQGTEATCRSQTYQTKCPTRRSTEQPTPPLVGRLALRSLRLCGKSSGEQVPQHSVGDTRLF